MKTEDCAKDCVGPDCEGCQNYIPKTTEMKAEQHKVIAEAMGLKILNPTGKDEYYDNRGHHVCFVEDWNPETNEEQTLLALKHFKIDTEYDEINKEWLAIKSGDDGIIIVCKRHRDFQTIIIPS